MVSFSPMQPRQSCQAGDPIGHSDHVGKALVEVGFRFGATGKMTEDEVSPPDELAVLYLSGQAEELARFLLHLLAELRSRCLLQLLDQDSKGAVAGIRCRPELAARSGEIGETCIPSPRLGEPADFERDVGELLQEVPFERIGALRAESILGGTEESIGTLHITALKAEMLRSEDGHSGSTVRISGLLGEGFDPVDLSSGFLETTQLGQDSVQGCVCPDLPGDVSAPAEGCGRTTIRLLGARRIFPAQISQIKKEPRVVRLAGDQLFEPNGRLMKQPAVTANIGEASCGLFRVGRSGETVLAIRESGERGRQSIGNGRQEQKRANQEEPSHFREV